MSEYPIELPQTDDEWFALIEPEITSNPVEATRSEVIDLAKQHATQVVSRTPLNISVEAIEWRATRELESKLGYCRSSRLGTYESYLIKLSVDALEACGWQEFMQMVRHELVHVWQFNQREYADDDFDDPHGESFEEWMDILSIEKTGSAVRPDWTVECPACNTTVHKIDESRRRHIAERLSELRPITCGNCESELTDSRIKCGDFEVPQDELPDIPTTRDNTVVLYNDGDPVASSDPASIEWDPKTRLLTELPGIGEAIASTIGSSIYTIEDLIRGNASNGTVTLAAGVQDAVSAQYHDALRTEVNQWYEEAQTHRTGETRNLLTRVIEETEHDWWNPVERIDGTGHIEALNLLLRDKVEKDDQLQLRFEDTGEYPVRVEDKWETPDGTPMIAVVIEADSPPINSEGMIYIQDPPQGKPPYYEYEDYDVDTPLEGGSKTRECPVVAGRKRQDAKSRSS
jgi:predicted SprT family Zn-dependent metalloprotease